MGNGQSENQVETIPPMTKYDYYNDEGNPTRSKQFTSSDNFYDINMLKTHKRSMTSKFVASETTSTEQSSPSTLSTSSNNGKRMSRSNRHIHPHTKINGNRVNRLRQHRSQTAK